MTDDDNPLAMLMQRLMDEQGWTQSELSSRAGVSQGLISMILSGRRPRPTYGVVDRLARVLTASPVMRAEILRVAGFPPSDSLEEFLARDPSLDSGAREAILLLYRSLRKQDPER